MQSITIYNSDSSSSLQVHSNTSDIGYVVSSPVSGLESPDVRVSSVARGGAHGSYTVASLYGSRLITLQGTIHGDSSTTLESRRDALEKILRYERDDYGLPAQKILKFTTLDGLNLQVDFIMQSPLQMAITDPGNSRFLIQLLAEDHLLVSQALNSETFTAPSGGGFVLPVVLPITFTASTGSNKTVTNAGNAEAYPTITFNGPLTNPRLQNSTTGEGFGLTQTLTSGEAVVIDMRNRTAVQDGTTNVIGNKTSVSKWWAMEPGSNDIFFGSSDTSDSGNVVLNWRDSYIGV